jgi:hypothetical protein
MAQLFDSSAGQGYGTYDPHLRLATLCFPKRASGGITGLPIEDDAFEEITDCLMDIGREDWSRRPRTYAVLRMMDSVRYMDAFASNGLNDNSFPYRNKRDLPAEIQSIELSEAFLELQHWVLSDACDLENENEGRHISVKDGDKLFKCGKILGKGLTGLVSQHLTAHEFDPAECKADT